MPILIKEGIEMADVDFDLMILREMDYGKIAILKEKNDKLLDRYNKEGVTLKELASSIDYNNKMIKVYIRLTRVIDRILDIKSTYQSL